MRRSLLVTGGAGFIGANFVHYWIKVHPEDRVTVLDALTYAGNASNLAPVAGSSALDFVRGDICDADLTARLLVERRIDTIVHFAAETHVDRSIHAPDPFLQPNVIGTHVLLTAARARRPPITWFAPTTGPSVCRLPRPTARTTTDPISFRRSSSPCSSSTRWRGNRCRSTATA